MGYLKDLISGRSKIDIRTDPIGSIIKQEGYPSPSQIKEHRGDASVKPYVLTEAVYYRGKGRRTNEREIIHPANTEVRAKHWNLGFTNEPEDIVLIYTHDWSENLSRHTVGGNYAILRLIGDQLVFGNEMYEPALILTNIRESLQKGLEKRLGEPSKDITPKDIIDKVESLKEEVGKEHQQKAAYKLIRRREKAYLRDLEFFAWQQEDKRKASELINEFDARIQKEYDELIRPEVIKSDSKKFFEDFAMYCTKDGVSNLDPNCRLEVGESPLLHNTNHLQYSGSISSPFVKNWKFNGNGQVGGSYLEDLLIYTINETLKGNPNAHRSLKAKIQETTDNVRKEGEMNDYRRHITFHRAMGVATISDLYLEFIKQAQIPPNYKVKVMTDIGLPLRYLKSELFLGVIEDYDQVTSSRDTDPRHSIPWLRGQFKIVRDYVGGDVEAYSLQQLEELRRSGDEEYVHTANKLLGAHKRLDDIANGGARGLRLSLF